MPKKNSNPDLPYWPSTAFIDACMKQLKEKGLTGSDEDIRSQVVATYRQKRAEILAEEEMKKYEKA